MLSPAPTLAVLAGGQGRRMGRAKGELTLNHRPILTRLLDRLAWRGPTLLVTAPGRERPPGCVAFDGEVTDPVAGEGPLRGLLTALDAAGTDAVVFVTVDMPGVTRPMIDRLITRLREGGSGTFGVCFADAAGAVQPFPCVLRREAAVQTRVDERLKGGRRSARGLFGHERFAIVAADTDWSPDVWINLNTPADVAAYETSHAEAPAESHLAFQMASRVTAHVAEGTV